MVRARFYSLVFWILNADGHVSNYDPTMNGTSTIINYPGKKDQRCSRISVSKIGFLASESNSKGDFSFRHRCGRIALANQTAVASRTAGKLCEFYPLGARSLQGSQRRGLSQVSQSCPINSKIQPLKSEQTVSMARLSTVSDLCSDTYCRVGTIFSLILMFLAIPSCRSY